MKPYEMMVTEDRLGQIREYSDGMVSTSLATDAGVLYSIRYDDGKLKSFFASERREQWYANVVTLWRDGAPALEAKAGVGPFLTFQQLCDKVAGRGVKVANPLDIRVKPTMGRHSNLDDEGDEVQWDEYITDSNVGAMRDYYEGTISSSLDSGCATLYSIRQPDGSTTALVTWEEDGEWFSHIVVFTAVNHVVLETAEKAGPFGSLDEACDYSGRKAGQIVARIINREEKRRKRRDRGHDDGG